MEVLLSDVLSQCHAGKKTGALFVVARNSRHLVRFYFDGGEVYSLAHGLLRGSDCLDLLEDVDYSTAVFFERINPPLVSSRNMPGTSDIIEALRSSGRTIEVNTSSNVEPVDRAPWSDMAAA